MLDLRVPATAFAAFVLFASSALADDCGHLKLISSVTLTPLEGKIAEFAPVTLAGQQKLMLIDTGGALTEITTKAADDLGLPRYHGNVQIFDVAGQYSDLYVNTPFALGNLTADKLRMMVTPGAGDVYTDVPQMVGILAPDIFLNYDLDIDFGTDKMNLISQDHCDGKVIYWPASAVAIVPIMVNDAGHIILTVQLDGRPVRAMLDTGASNTTLQRDMAEGVYGLKLGSADTPESGDLQDSPGLKVYRHTFQTLSLEGISVGTPTVEIIPNQTRAATSRMAQPELGTNIRNQTNNDAVSMLLGMNVLRHFHIYIAYKEQKLYITPAGSPAPEPAKTP